MGRAPHCHTLGSPAGLGVVHEPNLPCGLSPCAARLRVVHVGG
jgi:hypothetical protein